jgi:hypothetical protein
MVALRLHDQDRCEEFQRLGDRSRSSFSRIFRRGVPGIYHALVR